MLSLCWISVLRAFVVYLSCCQHISLYHVICYLSCWTGDFQRTSSQQHKYSGLMLKSNHFKFKLPAWAPTWLKSLEMLNCIPHFVFFMLWTTRILILQTFVTMMIIHIPTDSTVEIWLSDLTNRAGLDSDAYLELFPCVSGVSTIPKHTNPTRVE